jgi:probable addiction module antidote protein
MTIAIKPFDPAEYLDTPERIAAYLEEAFADGDPALIASALGDVARAKGMSSIAREAQLSREHLYRALSEAGKPEFATVLKVLQSFGLRLTTAPLAPEAASARPFSSKVSVAERVRPTPKAAEAKSALLAQGGGIEKTSAKSAAAASKVLRDRKASKTAKSVAASAMTQGDRSKGTMPPKPRAKAK